jgi:hypothetical protein
MPIEYESLPNTDSILKAGADGLAWWKGTMCPIFSDNTENIFKPLAQKYIDEYSHKKRRKDFIQEATEDLDKLAELLIHHSKDGYISADTMKLIEEKNGIPPQRFQTIFYLNMNILLNLNGFPPSTDEEYTGLMIARLRAEPSTPDR